jgi:hypothetical protein
MEGSMKRMVYAAALYYGTFLVLGTIGWLGYGGSWFKMFKGVTIFVTASAPVLLIYTHKYWRPGARDYS